MNDSKVVTLVADWSSMDTNDEVGRSLEALGSKQLPLIAVFPANDPYKPIVITGFYTQKQLVDAIEQAGESASIPSMNASTQSNAKAH